jgi:glycosyltransferase involved in cell wall biosynthesis
MRQYVIVTPVCNEEQHVRTTFESVLSRTIRLPEWVLVDDGSTDGTGVNVDQYAGQFPWPRVIHRRDLGSRKVGGCGGSFQ